jgi:hypothetical protein
LDGHSTSVNADGSFSYVTTSITTTGTVTAYTIDSGGLASNIASFEIETV